MPDLISLPRTRSGASRNPLDTGFRRYDGLTTQICASCKHTGADLVILASIPERFLLKKGLSPLRFLFHFTVDYRRIVKVMWNSSTVLR
jgi:hypothetical protein